MSDICSICLKSRCDSYSSCGHVYCDKCLIELNSCVVCGIILKKIINPIVIRIPRVLPEEKDQFEPSLLKKINNSYEKLIDSPVSESEDCYLHKNECIIM
jgi:hypothetical protein